MFFAPTTARSPKIRALYATIYSVLILGAITMIAPFLIMLSGSLEPRTQVGDTLFFPTYLVEDAPLWERYLETKYHGVNDLIRMSWEDPDVAFRKTGERFPPQPMLARWHFGKSFSAKIFCRKNL